MSEKKRYEPGIYTDISNEDYHASEGISRSMLMACKNSMLEYYHYYVAKDKVKPKNEAMLLGGLVNTLLLEPHKLDEEFTFYVKETGKGSREKNKLAKECTGTKQLVTESLLATAKEMADAVSNSRRAMQIIDGAVFEQSLFWIDEETGILCKARPDIWNKQIGVIADLKTALHGYARAFKYDIEDRGYHLQAAMILDGTYMANGLPIPSVEERIEIETYSFIVVPKEVDYKPFIYVLGGNAIELGRQEYRSALKLIKHCMEENKWDADRENVQLIDFSNWQLNNANPFSQQLGIYT